MFAKNFNFGWVLLLPNQRKTEVCSLGIVKNKMDTIRLRMYLRYVLFEENFQDTHTDIRMVTNTDTETNTRIPGWWSILILIPIPEYQDGDQYWYWHQYQKNIRRIPEDPYLFLTDTGCFPTTITRFDEHLCQYW